MSKPLKSKLNLTHLNAKQLGNELEKAHTNPVHSAILKSAVDQVRLHQGEDSWSFDLSFDLSWGDFAKPE